MGRSGASLDRFVAKRGPGCEDQFEYMKIMNANFPDLFPEVFLISDGYVMSMYRPCYPSPTWPQEVSEALRYSLWNTPPVTRRGNSRWSLELLRTLEIVTPTWAVADEKECTTHGDPTMCNTMITNDNKIVLIDAIWPVRVPQIAVVDQARILQSMLGWEIMIGHSGLVDWQMPYFLTHSYGEHRLRKLVFWAGVMMRRVEQSILRTDGDEVVASWARHLGKELLGAAGV